MFMLNDPDSSTVMHAMLLLLPDRTDNAQARFHIAAYLGSLGCSIRLGPLEAVDRSAVPPSPVAAENSSPGQSWACRGPHA